jgi:hypothetical protein
VAQVVDCLLSKYKAQSSNPSTVKKNLRKSLGNSTGNVKPMGFFSLIDYFYKAGE